MKIFSTSITAEVGLANSSVVDGCFGSQYSTLEGNGAVKNRENVASPTNARACDNTVQYNGEGGIRTRGTGYYPYDGLANRCLQPLGHLSGLFTIGELSIYTN